MENSEEIIEDDYKNYFEVDKDDDKVEENINNNNYIINNNIYNNNSFNSFNSYESTNPGNLNSFSFNNSLNSFNSFNPELPFSKTFQYRNNININNFPYIQKNKYLSDNYIIIIEIKTPKEFLELNSYNLFYYLTTQKGSKQGQNIINKMKVNEIDLLLNKLYPYLTEIFTDKYGNYFIIELIKILIPSQRILLLKYIKNNFIIISKNKYGTYPIRNLIEIINMSEEINIILNYILNNEIELAMDEFGYIVLKKIIKCIKEEERKELNINIIKKINELIFNQYGIVILIILIKNTKNEYIHKQIIEYIINNHSINILNIISHPYSNYLIQALLKYTNLEYCKDIIKIICNNYLNLSLSKYSNKVVEFSIKLANKYLIKNIFNDILKKDNLEILLNNEFGNYVLEKLFAKLNKDEKNIIIDKLKKIGKINKISKSIEDVLYR